MGGRLIGSVGLAQTAHITTPVAINEGGTGQTTAQAALDALSAASGTLVRGDIFYVDASLNVVRLARGSDNQVLKMSGSDVNWETLSAGGATVTLRTIEDWTDGQTTTSTTFTAVTGGTAVTLSRSGKCHITSQHHGENTSQGYYGAFCITDDGTPVGKAGVYVSALADYYGESSCTYTMECDESVINLEWRVNAGTETLKNGAMGTSGGAGTRLDVFEVA